MINTKLMTLEQIQEATTYTLLRNTLYETYFYGFDQAHDRNTPERAAMLREMQTELERRIGDQL